MDTIHVSCGEYGIRIECGGKNYYCSRFEDAVSVLDQLFVAHSAHKYEIDRGVSKEERREVLKHFSA